MASSSSSPIAERVSSPQSAPSPVILDVTAQDQASGFRVLKNYFSTGYQGVLNWSPRVVDYSERSFLKFPDVEYTSGGFTTRDEYTSWVKIMKGEHGAEWEILGIADAIELSTRTLNIEKDVVSQIPKYWCSETHPAFLSGSYVCRSTFVEREGPIQAWFYIRQKWLARSLLLMHKSTRSIDLIDHHISIH